jgi:hypothetical protein
LTELPLAMCTFERKYYLVPPTFGRPVQYEPKCCCIGTLSLARITISRQVAGQWIFVGSLVDAHFLVWDESVASEIAFNSGSQFENVLYLFSTPRNHHQTDEFQSR